MCPSCKIAGHSHSNSKKLANISVSFSPKQSLSCCISKTQIGGKFSQVRICVTEDANKWLNTSVMWANMLGSSRLPLSTWTTFEPPKTSKCSHCQKWSYQQRRNGAWTVTLLPHTCQKLYWNCHENSRKTNGKYQLSSELIKMTLFYNIRVGPFQKEKKNANFPQNG